MWLVWREDSGFDGPVAPTRGQLFKQIMTRVCNVLNDVFGSSLTLVTADSISWPSSKHVRWVCAAGRKLTAESFVSWTAAGLFGYIFHYDFLSAHAQLGCCVGGRQTLLSWVHLQIKSRKTVSISCTVLIHEACGGIMRWSIYLFIYFCHSCKIGYYFLLPCVGESYKWSYYRCLFSCFVLFRLWSIHSVLACDQRHVDTQRVQRLKG